jgi:hypothetical protein
MSSVIGIKLLEKIVILCFIFEKFMSRHLPKNISVVMLPYTGGISSEWDFLVWYYKSLKIKTLAIQENWDNLSSKQFLFQHPSNFATWARQSSSHLRTIQNFKGTINEIGCIRVQGFYENRHQLNKKPSAPEKYIEHDFLSILVIGIGDPLSDLKLLTSLSGYIEEKSDKLSHRGCNDHAKSYIIYLKEHSYGKNWFYWYRQTGSGLCRSNGRKARSARVRYLPTNKRLSKSLRHRRTSKRKRMDFYCCAYTTC